MNYLEKELFELIQKDKKVFDFIHNNVLDGLWYWDLENPENEYMNEKFWTTLGYDPKLKKHRAEEWQNLIHPDDLKATLKNYRAHYVNPEIPYDQIVRYKHKSGHYIWIRCRGIIIRDMNNHPTRMLGSHIDVTEAVKKNNAINSYEQTKEVLNSANIGFWDINLLDNTIETNAAFNELTGITSDKLITPACLFQSIDINDRAKAKEEWKKLLSSEVDQYIMDSHFEDDNNIVWVRDIGAITHRNSKGDPIKVRGIRERRTLEKENELKLNQYSKMLSDSVSIARIGTWEVDLINNTVFWSKVTREIHEVPDFYEPNLEEGINFYLEGQSRDLITNAFNKAVTEGVNYDLEIQLRTHVNNIVWVRAIGTPEFVNGQCRRVYGVFQDIDKEKREQLRIKELLKIKEDLNDRLLNFSHIVSHNLRSHSSNMKMLINILEEDYADLKNIREFNLLQKAITSLSETVAHLNEVASINSSSSESLTSCNLKNYVDLVMNQLQGIISKNNFSIKTDDLNFDVVAVPAYLESIILNLVTNAIKYRKSENPYLKIECKIISDFCQISFEDNGIGIDLKKHKNKLFGMYKVFHHHPEARGIGLFITKNQIEAMGGKIEVESKVNVGTKFTIYLKHGK